MVMLGPGDAVERDGEINGFNSYNVSKLEWNTGLRGRMRGQR